MIAFCPKKKCGRPIMTDHYLQLPEDSTITCPHCGTDLCFNRTLGAFVVITKRAMVVVVIVGLLILTFAILGWIFYKKLYPS